MISKQIVQFILNKYPEARDNKALLYTLYLKYSDCVKGKKNLKIIYEIFNSVNFESVGRYSRLIKQRNHKLRGKFYRKRKEREQFIKDNYHIIEKYL